jgi:predicted RNase H-like HicB family nuclease
MVNTARKSYNIFEGDDIMRKIHVLVHPAEEGGFWAEVPSLDGCFTQGESIDEIKANVREAISLCLEDEPGDYFCVLSFEVLHA